MSDELGNEGEDDDVDAIDDADPASPTVDDGADDAESDFDDEELWGPSDRAATPVDKRIIFGVVGVVAVLILGFVVFGGGSSSSDGGDDASTKTSTDGKGETGGGSTQVTSQRAPYNATGITPTTLPPGAEPTGCGDWDSAFNFPPAEITEGVYIWSDFEGWHVRVAGTAVPELSGSVTGQYMPPLQGQTEGIVSVTPDEAGKRLTFSMAPGGEPVGFDFSAGCNQKELTFDLTTEGTSVPFEQIHLGSRGAVKEYPLVARRTLPEPG